MNISGTLNVFKLIREPTLCLPQATVSTFNHLPVPLSKAFEGKDGKKVDIRAVILDKDNCFAVPHENEIYGPYKVSFLFDCVFTPSRGRPPKVRWTDCKNSKGLISAFSNYLPQFLPILSQHSVLYAL